MTTPPPPDFEPPAKILTPVFTPLRNLRDPESRRRAQEAHDREVTEQLDRCRAEWLRLRERLTDPGHLAVLDLHQPTKTYSGVTCEECASYDGEGLSVPDWPCPTVQAIAAALENS
jgi:hypothetical protein